MLYIPNISVIFKINAIYLLVQLIMLANAKHIAKLRAETLRAYFPSSKIPHLKDYPYYTSLCIMHVLFILHIHSGYSQITKRLQSNNKSTPKQTIAN